MDKEKQIEIEELSKKLRAYAYDLKLNDNDDCRRVAEFIVETLNYRKTEEVTLKLDLGDRTPEEIKRIAEHFGNAMSTTPIPIISLSDNEIGKKVTKEIFEMLIFWTQNQKTWGKTIDIDELIQCLQQFAREKGVEIK